MSLPKKIITGIIWLCVQVIAAQAQYRFDSWTTDNGLPQNSVNSMLQTADGYLWFTTLDGLVRFDGVKFTVFNKSNSKNLPTNRLIDLIIDDENSLWICTEAGGLVRYANGEFQAFTTADGLPSNTVYEVLKDSDGGVLAFTRNGIARFADNRFSPVIDEKNRDYHEFRIYPAPSGIRFELNAEALIAGKDGNKTSYDLPPNLTKILTPNFNFFYFVKMFEDRDGTLWLWVNPGKLFKFKDDVFDEITATGMPSSVVRVITQDRQGDIWLGSEREGACRLSQNKFVCFDSTKGLTGNFVTDIFSDREGTLWMATNDKGICRLTKQTVTTLSTAEKLAQKNVYSILETANGAMWLGSFGAVAKYESGVMTNYGKPEGLIYPFVQSLFEDTDGRLFVGGLDGVQYFENGRFYDFMNALGAKAGDFIVTDIHRDRRGILWLATTAGVVKYDGATAVHLTTKDGLPNDFVKTILEAKDGTLWIGTYDGLAKLSEPSAVADGLSRNVNIPLADFNRPLPQTVLTFTEKDGLAGNHIRALYEDETGAMWIGTYDSGLSRFKDGKFTVYNIGNGLFSNGVFQILPDERGNFWMSSNQGIYRVSRAELNDYADGKRQNIVSTSFGKSDGMLSTEANGGGQPAGTKTRDGQLWFPTQDGAAIINPEAVEFNPLPPPVVIETVRIDNKSEPFAVANDSTRQTENSAENSNAPNGKLQPPATADGSDIVLEPGQENLEIDYTGLSFIKPEQVRFRYKLAGLDENWTEAGARRTAFYPHLSPGEYVFQVIAANSDNVWNETGASVKISVKPPFYRTYWFYAACLLLFLIVVYAFYRVRVSQLERARRTQEEFSRRLINVHESERRRIAAELHDSIGQSLAMIKNRAVLGAESVMDENARRQLELITAQTTQTIGEVREISYNLRPYLLDQLGLKKAVLSLLNKLNETGQLKIQTEIDEIDNLYESEAEMSIYRIIQESLSNIVKHSGADEAQVFITKSERNLTILISDNGKGFDINSQHTGEIGKGGFGLIGMSERVRMLGGTQEIETESGAGTTILIKIPLKNAETRTE